MDNRLVFLILLCAGLSTVLIWRALDAPAEPVGKTPEPVKDQPGRIATETKRPKWAFHVPVVAIARK